MNSKNKLIMNIAKPDDFENVWEVFKKNRNYLGHIMKAKITK